MLFPGQSLVINCSLSLFPLTCQPNVWFSSCFLKFPRICFNNLLRMVVTQTGSQHLWSQCWEMNMQGIQAEVFLFWSTNHYDELLVNYFRLPETLEYLLLNFWLMTESFIQNDCNQNTDYWSMITTSYKDAEEAIIPLLHQLCAIGCSLMFRYILVRHVLFICCNII